MRRCRSSWFARKSEISSARAAESPVANTKTGRLHPIAGTMPAPRLLDMLTPKHVFFPGYPHRGARVARLSTYGFTLSPTQPWYAAVAFDLTGTFSPQGPNQEHA